MGHLGGSVGWVSDLSSGHDLQVPEFKPHGRLAAVGTEPTSDPLFLFLSAPPCLHSLKNKYNIKKNVWMLEDKIKDSSLELSEGTQLCQHLDLKNQKKLQRPESGSDC